MDQGLRSPDLRVAHEAAQSPFEVPLKTPCRTLGEVVGAAGVEFRDREAYVFRDQRMTYGEWLSKADALAAGLVGIGVQAGDVVALMLETSLDYPIAWAAAARLGAVVTGLNLRLGAREIAAILGRCRPTLVIAEDGLDLPWGDATVVRRRELARLSLAPAPCTLPASPPPSAPAVIIWTSGTTGVPKGAWFDHDNLAAHVATGWPMTAPFDRKLVSVPLVHAGYMSKLWEQAAMGMTIVLAPTPWTVDAMFQLMVEERITSGGGVPTQLAKLLERPDLETADLSQLRVLVAAAAPAPPEMVEALGRRTGCAVISRYAMTECPSITGTQLGDPPEVLYRTVGRPAPGTELLLTDEGSHPVPHGEVGRLRVRSPCVMRGYWNMPEETAAALTPDGWLISSDLGRLDEAGNLVLAGRTSDMYIRGGYNVYPLEVENVLTEHPSVAAAAVVGHPAGKIGEIGVAFVVPTDPGAPPSLELLRAWCGARLADYKSPDRLELVSSLPLTAAMKIDKSALRLSLQGD